jgi:hypothetical protein
MIMLSPFLNGHDHTKGVGRNCWTGRLEHLPPALPVAAEEAAERMFDDGFVQFPDLLSGDEVQMLREWMDRSGGPDEQYEMKNWCFNRHQAARPHQDPMWLTLMDRSPVYECLALILKEDFILSGGSLWTTGKGRQMGLHIDFLQQSLPSDVLMDPRVRIPIHTASLHLYLDDQVEEIGPTVLVPGSWRAGRYPREEGEGWNGVRPAMLSLKAGGGMLFRHDLWHGAEMNSSTRRRYMIQLHFATRRNAPAYPPLLYPSLYGPEVLAQATPRQRRLLGEAAQPASVY